MTSPDAPFVCSVWDLTGAEAVRKVEQAQAVLAACRRTGRATPIWRRRGTRGPGPGLGPVVVVSFRPGSLELAALKARVWNIKRRARRRGR